MSKYWFRKRQGLGSKDLGWGWRPISWQGWVVVIAMILVTAITAVVVFGHDVNKGLQAQLADIVVFLLLLLAYILICVLISRAKSQP